MIPSDVDGAAEEGTPFVPAHGMRRISDREIFLVMKEFEPAFSHGGDMAIDALAGAPVKELQRIGKAADEEAEEKTKGFEVGYELFGINGRMLGHGEPIRVKAGERVLFHVLNASATEIRSLALPGHLFRITALDGNPVPAQADVPVLWLGAAERISALVEMKHPGVWLMGDLADDDRRHGMGIVVEYAEQKGKPQWVKPKPFHWDYTQFGKANEAPAAPDEAIAITIVKHNGALTVSTSGPSTAKRSQWRLRSRCTRCMKGAATA
jgi:FtsP/CotA-like multicopper oxidase with cupredoxin domain